MNFERFENDLFALTNEESSLISGGVGCTTSTTTTCDTYDCNGDYCGKDSTTTSKADPCPCQ